MANLDRQRPTRLRERPAPPGRAAGGSFPERASGGAVGGSFPERASGRAVGGSFPERASGRAVGGSFPERASGRAVGGSFPERASGRAGTGTASSWATVAWVLVALGVAVTAVVLGWHSRGGVSVPASPGQHMSRTTAVINSAILVFREGLETILVLAAITASFLGGNRVYRRPVAIGGGLALAASVGTWFAAVWFIGVFGGDGLNVQAATGIPAIVVLLLVMNWFFHKVYWTGWISHHHRRRRSLLPTPGQPLTRSMLLGLGLLGFTSVYREGFEVVLFLQGLRVSEGSSVVLEGVALGMLFTAAVGVLTFMLHTRLPYKRLLIITGALLVAVLWVMVGEEVNEMQLAGWIGTTQISWMHVPGWLGTWFSVFPNVQTFAAQGLAVLVVLGSYVGAQYLRVWRPRRRGLPGARFAGRPPEAVGGSSHQARGRSVEPGGRPLEAGGAVA